MREHYILDGHETKACDLLTWARWFEKADGIVARDTVGDSEVSTVFLGGLIGLIVMAIGLLVVFGTGSV